LIEAKTIYLADTCITVTSF